MNELAVEQSSKPGELLDQSVSDLLEMLDQIESSLKTTEELTVKAGRIEDNGRMKAIWSGISGKSDRELASIVKGLGANVKVTQEVVKFLIELAQYKSTVQEGFLGALDRKISEQQNKLSELDKNDGSLDENARQVETAVLTLYKQVHAQVESELKLRKSVDQNMDSIDVLFDAVESKGKTDTEQSEQIAELIQAVREKALSLEQLSFSLEAKEERLTRIAGIVEDQSGKLTIIEQGLEEKTMKITRMIDDIQENTSADRHRAERISNLETKTELLAKQKLPLLLAISSIVLAGVTAGFSIYQALS